MTARNLPDYVEGGGRYQVWRPPYRATQANLLVLVLRADQRAVDRMLDRDLNAPAGGAVTYRCAHPNVLVTLAEVPDLRSSDPPDSLRGFLAERELSIWCLLVDRTARDRLVWYLPYVLTDSGQTVYTGREVYGYPKQVGTFDASYPGVIAGTATTTTVSALAIPTYGGSAQAIPHPIVTVSRSAGPGAPPAPAESSWEREIRRNLFPGGFTVDDQPGVVVRQAPAPSATITVGTAPPPPRPTPPAPHVRPVLRRVPGRPLDTDPDTLAAELARSPTLVFLKQFRDVRCPTKACYQAIVEATISIDPLGPSFRPLDPALFGVTVRQLDSHPLATELGLRADQRLVPDRAFQATLSFDIMTGLEVWRAPT